MKFTAVSTDLEERFAKELDRRGIPKECAEAAGLVPLYAHDIRKLLGRNDITSDGIAILYLDANGEPLPDPSDLNQPYCRYRLFEPHQPKGSKGKPQRYIQRSKSGSQAYLALPAPDSEWEWPEVVSNTDIPILITEGELKALKASQSFRPTAFPCGLPCIGLGGVNMAIVGGHLLPLLNSIQWTRRLVYIAFDADEESTMDVPLKKTVASAAQTLGHDLASRGAMVRIVHIARSLVHRPGEKMGLDDFLLANPSQVSVDGLLELFETPDPKDEWARLLREYAIYVGRKAGVIRLADGETTTRESFTKVWEAPATRAEMTEDGKLKFTKLAEKLFEHPQRLVLRRFIVDPARGWGYDRESEEFNWWPGLPEGAQWDRRYAGQFLRLVRVLFGRKYRCYVLQWMAHMVQRPGERCNVALIITSALQGIGKSALGEILCDVVGERLSKKGELGRLKGFNKELEGILFIRFDEANALHAKVESTLNEFITADRLRIEGKGLDAYEVNNYARVYISSNAAAPIRVNKNERRFLVTRPEIDDVEVWKEWVNSAVKQLRSSSGTAAVRALLMNIDLTGFDPTMDAPVTEYMEDMVAAGRTVNGSAVECLVEQFEADGIWFVSSDFRLAREKIWGDFALIVSDVLRGQCLFAEFTVGGRRVRGTIYTTRGNALPARKKESGKKGSGRWAIDVGQRKITPEERAEWEKRAKAAYLQASLQIREVKY